MTPNGWGDAEIYDYTQLVADLNQYLRLKTLPVGMKRFRTVAEMEAIPRLRRPPAGEKFATDQQVVAGLKALSDNGLRYPIPNHGIQKSPLDSITASYGKR